MTLPTKRTVQVENVAEPKTATNDFISALTQLGAERGLAREEILDAIESALVHAYRREYGLQPEVRVHVDPVSGHPRLYEMRRVTLVNTGEADSIPLTAARQLQPDVREGARIEVPFEMPAVFGRVAAQACKQVVLQKMREAERDHVFDEFSEKENELVSGVVLRSDQQYVYVNLGKTEAVLPAAEKVSTERYIKGQHLRFYVLEVTRSPKGPQVILSRSHRNLLKRLLEIEVPEIRDGTVEIRALAREPGSRSKVAVYSRQPGLDPIGACVGVHRTRIQNVVKELRGEPVDPGTRGEQVDIIQWDPDPATFVSQALNPARVLHVQTDESTHRASVLVPADQMSLAIGKEGQNARLAAKLTQWRIDIRTSDDDQGEPAPPARPLNGTNARRVAE